MADPTPTTPAPAAAPVPVAVVPSDRPHKQGKRAYETLAKEKRLGIVARVYLMTLAYLDDSIRIRNHIEAAKQASLSINRQLPRSHTERYKLRTIWYWYPLYCLGGLAFISFIILTISGVVLALYYIPNYVPQEQFQARDSVNLIMTKVTLGYVLRGVHHWGAHLMVACVFLHMMRVYFVGAYKKPRELNWVLGVALIGITFFFAYSGYLLPADQLAIAAATIGQNMFGSIPGAGSILARIMFGGTDINAGLIPRMYILHVWILPFVLFGLMVLHMFIVWLQGMAEPH
ncbi:MAG TPA: cytochrome bc complex cytochrome b subunit [Candidatus Thermoplasmatota archaeon]|nr:cytochrome bc complex cytochrome b subunit [Candidatus Thermoplasmatota archaeon]